MIIRIIVLGYILCTVRAQTDDPQREEIQPLRAPLDPNLPNFRQCLTGYMTDVQSWVLANGTLTNSDPKKNSVDLSFKSDALPMLLQHMTKIHDKKQSVKILSMAVCGLREIPPIFTWSDGNNKYLSDTVEYVSFFGNKFDVPVSNGQYDVFMNATRSRELTAYSMTQRITRSWTNGFTGVHFPKLKELDLRSCSIAVLADRAFVRMTNLESLYLGENAIVHIEATAFIGLRKIIHLDLSRNFIHEEESVDKSLVIESMDLFSDLINLQSLDFSFTKLTPRNNGVLRSLSNKMKRLSLCHCAMGRLRNDAFINTTLKYLDISSNPDALFHHKALHGIEETLKVLYAEDIALKTMEPFKKLRHLEILKLTNNEINTTPKHIVETLNNLQVLDLDKNRMITWFERHISLMSNLKFLSLRHNNLNMITDEMATDLANTSYVGLSNNFIICNCNARDLYELGWRNEKRVTGQVLITDNNGPLDNRMNFHTGFHDYNSIILDRSPLERECNSRNRCDTSLELLFNGDILFFDYNSEGYQCLEVAEETSTSFQNFPTCSQKINDGPTELIRKTWNKFLLVIIPAILLPALAVLFVFRRSFVYFLITMRNSAMLSLINKKEGQDDRTIFNYDVFVSYCNEDRAWVLDQLLPHVERDCNISVCLHERDFQVGLSILENIVSCMDRSRSIMLILSQRFLLSQWCQFEMHLAQHRLLETRREDLILILLEEIPRRVRPNTLHYLMLTKTYIVWPKVEGEQKQFWRRLKKSLVTHKLKHTENDSLA